MAITIKTLCIVVLLFFTCPIFGMKKQQVRKRATKHVRFANEENLAQSDDDTQEVITKSSKRKKRCQKEWACVCCMNVMVAGVCSLASGAVMLFSTPQTTMQLLEHFNKTT